MEEADAIIKGITPAWLPIKTEIANNALLRKIARSMERDKNIPLSFKLRKGLIYLISMLSGKINLGRCNKVGERPRTRRRPYIENMGAIIIGDDVNINSRNVQTDLVTGPKGILKIGNEVSINFGVSIVASKSITIGNRVRIGPYTMIYDSDRHVHGNRFEIAPGDPLVIEDDVWLASRVMVLRGSRIGKGSLVAAGSVVSGIIPPYVMAGGIPARIIKYLDPPKNSGFCWEHNIRFLCAKEHTFFRVRKIASEVFSTELDFITGELSHSTIPHWNSFQHVKFIHKLEREFDIRLDPKDWTRLTSIDKIARIVQKYLDKQPVHAK